MSEVIGLEDFYFDTLATDTGAGGVSTLVAGRIYVDEAPAGVTVTYPFVLISPQADASDVVSLGPHRVLVNTLYWIRVVGKGASKKALQAIADRIDSLLQAAGGVTASVRVLMINREFSPALPPATVNGQRYVQLGGVYRAYVQAV
jgi:hypothetical protein